MQRDRILIEKANIPYRFSIALPTELYELEIRYNTYADLFTVSLYKSGDRLCIEPMIYGAPLFRQMYKAGTFPPLVIVPQAPDGETGRVTWNNFGVTVFLEIMNYYE